MRKTALLCGLIMICLATAHSNNGLIAWWNFNESGRSVVVEQVGQIEDKVKGNFSFSEGITGSGFKFEGFTTGISRDEPQELRLAKELTIEAWIALGAYPWNWAPILVLVSTDPDKEAGYYFGIDSEGRLGLRFSVNGRWVSCTTEIPEGIHVGLELRAWTHVAATYDQNSGIHLYINGDLAATSPITGFIDFIPATELVIGRNNRPLTPTHPVRTWATYPSWYSFDGIIDELKVHDQALTGEELAASYASVSPPLAPDIPPRQFPTAPPTGEFGAIYTKLKYYDEWDALWRSGDYSDVMVQFDEHPIKVMFWRGSRYSACWVSENGKWMADQSRETGENWDAPIDRYLVPTGCCEHMSDARCRHSHVRIIESNDARIVVHWRYALIDVMYRQSGVDPVSGWGYWCDEYYYIHPDGVAVRKVLPGEGGWQETIFFNEPGTKPEDNVELEAVTLANLEGESRTYSWEHGYPEYDLPEPIIQMTNMRSRYRPFMIFRPGSEMEVFNVEVRLDFSHFPWWNHWPVAQVISDGRHALAPDRAAHSSLSWGDPVDNAALYGMTDQGAESLVSLAKSWISPPELTVQGSDYVSEGYDFTQRAYMLEAKVGSRTLEQKLNANEDSPVQNPGFVIKNWGSADADLALNGKPIPRGPDFRLGHNHSLESSDLIVWIKTFSTAAIRISLTPVGG